MRRPSGRTIAETAVLVLLTWIAIGVLDAQRGLWQDDAQILFRQFAAGGSGWRRFFLPYASPARRLVGLPFQVALWTPWPVSFLYALLGAAWLSTGLLARAIARRLWPALPGVGFLAAAFTIAATPDFFTASLVALHYVLSIVAALGALLALLDWCARGGRWRLALAVCGLVVGLLLTDTPLTVWLLGPLLLLAVPTDRRRVVIGLIAWYAAALPYLMLVLPAALDPASYLSHALQAMSWPARARRLLDLAVFNLTPWRWSLGRPLWFPREGLAMGMGTRVALASLGALAAAVAFASRGRERERAPERPQGVRAAVSLVILALAANALVASVALSEFRCRTHLLSRVWVALLLAAACAWCATRGRAAALVSAAAAGVWIAWGLLGGLERQDYFAGHWRRHQAELRSLRDAAPGLAPDARLLLRMGARPGFAVTDSGYLARAWMTLLHADPTLECRVALWAEGRPASCAAEGAAIVCRGERSPDCVRREGRREDTLPIDRLVWIEYDPQARLFGLRRSLPPGLDPAGLYAPDALIVDRPLPDLARGVLDRPQGTFATQR